MKNPTRAKAGEVIPARATPDEIHQATAAAPWEYAEAKQFRAPLVNVSTNKTYVNNSTNVTNHAPASTTGSNMKVVAIVLAVIGLIIVAPETAGSFAGAIGAALLDVLSGGSA